MARDTAFGNVIPNLRHRIQIKNFTRTSDGQGGFTEAENLVATLWARVRPVGETELNSMEQLQEQVTHVVEIRSNDSVNAKQFVEFDGRKFRILAKSRPFERKIIDRLLCREEEVKPVK